MTISSPTNLLTVPSLSNSTMRLIDVLIDLPHETVCYELLNFLSPKERQNLIVQLLTKKSSTLGLNRLKTFTQMHSLSMRLFVDNFSQFDERFKLKIYKLIFANKLPIKFSRIISKAQIPQRIFIDNYQQPILVSHLRLQNNLDAASIADPPHKTSDSTFHNNARVKLWQKLIEQGRFDEIDLDKFTSVMGHIYSDLAYDIENRQITTNQLEPMKTVQTAIICHFIRNEQLENARSLVSQFPKFCDLFRISIEYALNNRFESAVNTLESINKNSPGNDFFYNKTLRKMNTIRLIYDNETFSYLDLKEAAGSENIQYIHDVFEFFLEKDISKAEKIANCNPFKTDRSRLYYEIFSYFLNNNDLITATTYLEKIEAKFLKKRALEQLGQT